MIFDIKFETKKDRGKFEEAYGLKKRHTLVSENSPCHGIAWTFLRDVFLNPVYYMGFMGYGEPKEILKECLEGGIKIKFLAWISINDKESSWEKIRGRW